MDLQQIIGFEGDWNCTEDDSPNPVRLTFAAGKVLRDGKEIGRYVEEDRYLRVTFDVSGDLTADVLTATKTSNLAVATGQRRYSFTNDIPESEGGSGPLAMEVRLERVG